MKVCYIKFMEVKMITLTEDKQILGLWDILAAPEYAHLSFTQVLEIVKLQAELAEYKTTYCAR